MMKKTPLTAAIAVLALSLSAASATSAPGFPAEEYKDPFLAGVLSWVMPGAGQIYAHAYTKGSLFVGGELVDKAALLGLILYIHDRYGKVPGGGQINWQRLNDTERGMIIVYATLTAGFRIFTSLDAVRTTHRFNRLMGFSAGLDVAPLAADRRLAGLDLRFRRTL